MKLEVHGQSEVKSISKSDLQIIHESLRECKMLPKPIQLFPKFQAWVGRVVQKHGLELVTLKDAHGELVAMCMLNHANALVYWGEVEITTVCVRASHRRKGYCKIMLEKLIEFLQQRNKSPLHRVRGVRIFCESGNGAACKCYRHVFGKPVFSTEGTVAYIKYL